MKTGETATIKGPRSRHIETPHEYYYYSGIRAPATSRAAIAFSWPGKNYSAFKHFFAPPHFPPDRPYSDIFSLFFVLFLSVKHLLSSCSFVRATAVTLSVFCHVQQASNVLQRVCFSVAFPFRSSCITFFRTPAVCFALLASTFFFSFFSFPTVWLVLGCHTFLCKKKGIYHYCFVVFSCPVR